MSQVTLPKLACNLSNPGVLKPFGIGIKKPHFLRSEVYYILGVPKGIRTPVAAVKGRSPRPLDDGDPDLSHSDFFLRYQKSFGGARRDRTADLLRATQALSQLSYSPEEARTLT